ncbi:MAG TPA: UvrD-helicase domain-containing protein [Candidatus Paceibacterota bacterium]
MSDLNAKQREAVEHKDGPLLVVAGAGTGKTRVITHRIAHLISRGVKPSEILAVTFTNKASAEMRDRATALISAMSKQQFANLQTPFVGTFHSLGVHILRESGQALGISRWFTIYDRDNSVSLIRKCLKSEGFDPKQFAPAAVLSTISKAKGNLVSREDFASGASSSYFGDVVARVWREYEKELREQKALDFDDLLVQTVKLLNEFKDVRGRYQSEWKYIHVDEYQDTNKVQYEMVRLLVGNPPAGGNLCVVGDADQTIYTWRGATIENILGFEEDFPGAKVVILEENYRSTSNILDAANAVIAKNEGRKEKNLFTSSGSGEKISVHEAFDPSDEARFVTQTISKIKSQNAKFNYENAAVLYRANFQSRALEEAFLEAGIPYTVLGTRFFERAEVKDIISYVKAALNQSDRISFARAVASPRRGIGEKSLEHYFATGEVSEKISGFIALLQDFEGKLETLPLPDALRYITIHSGYEAMLKQSEEQERLENVQELINLSNKYKNLNHDEALEKFLTDTGLTSDQDTLLHERQDKKRGVRLMTVHAAKGLEFEHVFIVGLEQDLFPHRPMDDPSTGLGQAIERGEEERRLFYVALTRAKKQAYLSWCQTRQMYGETRVQMASEYLGDVPSELIESATDIQLDNLASRPPSKRSEGLLPDIEDLEY